ncbi:M20/M25/M40 family metallo-hydrolase [Amycolatopsis cihanbeyliensis]|uniref:Acetylornithine deacetylase n=1 Tax=Amycolatopsis cihanbeyliensis TaxID=1128664 RepID=A0A542DPX4_AMYCI|nr:M20/M25/M40 family metallo-hydrolase [Amycolatopsis cihanbeyliensis]TQJ05117.1 acetylornithine deacetylase [Amycolatopsis cihanbeyliensis]
MSLLGHVASTRKAALYVVKVGSASLRHGNVFDELAAIYQRGARVLLVAGGAAGIAEHYADIGRTMRTLHLRGGDEIRYCPPEEMPFIVSAYEQVTLPRVRRALSARGLTAHTAVAAEAALVCGTANPPLRAVRDGRTLLVRDHRAGLVSDVDTNRLLALLEAFDVVCVSPPVACAAGGSALNVDADVLAAELANALDADHLRLVTGTPGLLADPADPTSRQAHLLAGTGARYARGRMRHKVRAAEIALTGAADVAITGPHVLAPASGTRFWRAVPPAPDVEFLSRSVEISSVSGDERELADYLVDWCTEHGIDAEIDLAGNLVAVRGGGPHRLLMLGHLDTVPHRWPARWEGDTLSGRGCVDAKGSLVTFLETLAELDVPPWAQVRVVGAVEEEMTAAGAFFARDNYPADAVIIGEPSGAGALTISYNGLLKVRLSVRAPVGHTAGNGVSTAADELVDVVHRVRTEIAAASQEAMPAVLGIDARNGGDEQIGEAVLDVRVPHSTDVHELAAVVTAAAAPMRVEVLRATPGYATSRTSPLVRAFSRAFREAGVTPRFLAKKGSSDMNTLATTWRGVPMIAYGPGDASLDHTPAEHLAAAEFRQARTVLAGALAQWAAQVAPASAA